MECRNDYASCDLFDDYSLSVCKVSVPYLQIKNAVLEAEEDWQQVYDECNDYSDFLSIDSIVAVAADSGSQDPFWWIGIIEKNCIANSQEPDCYGNKIVPGQRYLRGHYLEEYIKTKTSFSINSLNIFILLVL